MSSMTSFMSDSVGVCPRLFRSTEISSESMWPSPLTSSLSKMHRTSILTRVSLTVYHLLNSSKPSLSSSVSGMRFQSFLMFSSATSESSPPGPCQPSLCMKTLNSLSLMWSSPSVSRDLNVSRSSPFSSVTMAMPAVSVMLACWVSSLTMPPRKVDGILILTRGPRPPARSSTVMSLSTFLSGSGETARFRRLLSTQFLNLSLNFMKEQ
mmetsp:Transcript_55809/g.125881  ORF Transcript_55809/g.125881 Transcript_55809/m.125881 type:complete len:209 (+) Transcript_55809:1058-1684(+)